ncbi:MSP7-like protein C-terminal domain containing protein, putative, partial [Plasmodium ovale]
VKYMDSLYDEIITESGQNEKAENTKKHSNYSNLKKKYNFPMNGKEYNMVKKLFGECFKKGDTTNASENATCQVDVLAKVLQDKEFGEQFDNFMHGLYSFAKRHTYLSDARLKDENAIKNFLKNALSLLNTF